MNKKSWSVALLAVVLILALAYYWHHLNRYPSTEDAYIQTHISHISAEIPGKIDKILVVNNQQVQADEVLFELDPTEHQLAVKQAKAALELTMQQVSAQQEFVAMHEATLRQRHAELAQAQLNASRVQQLVKKALASAAEADEMRTKVRIAEEALIATTKQLQQAKARLGNVQEAFNAEIVQAQAHYQQAQLRLARTKVKAPVSGTITNLKARLGESLNAYRPILAIVETDSWWVDAHFKETQLTQIKPGQTATVALDLYPNLAMTGEVESINPSSGSIFSLLPPENATGNWVKVTQRFTVKIKLHSAKNPPLLRAGASATVTVDTRSQ